MCFGWFVGFVIWLWCCRLLRFAVCYELVACGLVVDLAAVGAWIVLCLLVICLFAGFAVLWFRMRVLAYGYGYGGFCGLVVMVT